MFAEPELQAIAAEPSLQPVFSLFCLCVYIYVCPWWECIVCACIYVGAYAHCVHACGGLGLTLSVFSMASLSDIWTQGFLLSLESQFGCGSLLRRPPAFAPSCTASSTSCSVGLGDLNFNLHVCLASTLPAEPPFCLHVLLF